MSDIVASVHPRHAQAILDGTKTVELRKRAPRCAELIDRMYIYETAPTSLVVGRVMVVSIQCLSPDALWMYYGHRTCVTEAEFFEYFDGHLEAYGIEVAVPRRYARPWAITDLGLKRPPQSWCYVPDPTPWRGAAV